MIDRRQLADPDNCSRSSILKIARFQVIVVELVVVLTEVGESRGEAPPEDFSFVELLAFVD